MNILKKLVLRSVVSTYHLVTNNNNIEEEIELYPQTLLTNLEIIMLNLENA